MTCNTTRYETFPDGTSVGVQVTEEGLIIDTFDGEGVPMGTFAKTWDELYEFVNGSTLPEWLWPDPNQQGWWIDAWNGVYDDLGRALEEGAAGVGQEWILRPGEGIITEDEVQRRLERHRWGQENK